MDLRTPLNRVKHLGGSQNGTEHFIRQRVTALFMIPLLIWFVVTIVMLVTKNSDEIPWILISPISIIGAMLFIINAFYHASLGLRMIIEDYIHHHTLKIAALLVMYGIIITTVLAGSISVFIIYILSRTL